MSSRELAAPIKIGNNVWIGGSSIIYPGATAINHTTIGAGSVAVKDLSTNVVAVENLCRIVRHLP